MAIIVMEYMKLRNKHPDKKPDWWVLDLYVNGSKEIKKNPELEKDIKDIINRFESGDRTLIKIFSSLTNECIKGHKQTLSSIGIKIDQFFRESKLVFDGSVNRILNKIKKLPEGKIEGKRIWVNLKGIEREFTLTRADGTSLYPARDLAFHEYKFSKADFNINVIGTDHRFYFKQLVPTLGLLFPDSIKKYKIVFYEFLLTPLGTMSTRLGKFVSVDELVDKVIKTAGKVVEEKMPEYSKVVKKKIAELVGMGALKYAMLRVSPEKTYSFNIKDILSFEGNTAPYIQYTYVRACSILRKGKVKINKFDAKELKNENERLLIKQLSRFPVIVRDSATAYKPHYIASYVYELATMFNEFYHSLPVLKAEKKLKTARLALVESVSIVLKNALGLLGIKAPERM
jgi:arginyl-tRNA synthetase